MRVGRVALIASVAAGVCGNVIQRQTNSSAAAPIPPKQDPWYTAPRNFEDYDPGTVFKIRNASGIVPIIANSSAAYNILYRTTNSQYKPSWAVTTLILPSSWNSTKKNKLLSYQIPYDSADLDASPSYSLYSGGGLFGAAEISIALGRGWAVVTADYEGPLASFTAGVTSGHATIDSVRSVFKCKEFGFKSQSKTTKALWGYSGGALAGEWAAELQVQYAPELKFAGAALGGLTPNVSSVLLTIDGTSFAGLAPSGILGLASQFPDAMAYLESQLFETGPYNATTFNAVVNYTLIETVGAFAGKYIEKYFKNGYGALESPVAQRIINSDGTMGYHGVPTFPLFVYKAVGDDVSNITDSDKLIARYCEVGATIKYDRNTLGNHATELGYGRARALAFLDSVFAGTYNATGCQISDVAVTT